MIITEAQKTAMAKYIPNIDELVNADDVDSILGFLDAAMLDSLDINDESTPETSKIIKLFDDFWAAN